MKLLLHLLLIRAFFCQINVTNITQPMYLKALSPSNGNGQRRYPFCDIEKYNDQFWFVAENQQIITDIYDYRLEQYNSTKINLPIVDMNESWTQSNSNGYPLYSDSCFLIASNTMVQCISISGQGHNQCTLFKTDNNNQLLHKINITVDNCITYNTCHSIQLKCFADEFIVMYFAENDENVYFNIRYNVYSSTGNLIMDNVLLNNKALNVSINQNIYNNMSQILYLSKSNSLDSAQYFGNFLVLYLNQDKVYAFNCFKYKNQSVIDVYNKDNPKIVLTNNDKENYNLEYSNPIYIQNCQCYIISSKLVSNSQYPSKVNLTSLLVNNTNNELEISDNIIITTFDPSILNMIPTMRLVSLPMLNIINSSVDYYYFFGALLVDVIYDNNNSVIANDLILYIYSIDKEDGDIEQLDQVSLFINNQISNETGCGLCIESYCANSIGNSVMIGLWNINQMYATVINISIDWSLF